MSFGQSAGDVPPQLWGTGSNHAVGGGRPAQQPRDRSRSEASREPWPLDALRHMPSRRTSSRLPASAAGADAIDSSFAEVAALIDSARQRAFQAVNTELIGMYWEIGRDISAKLEAAVWGKGVVDRAGGPPGANAPRAAGLHPPQPVPMRQLYEAYRDDEKVRALLTQLPWTHNLIILGQAKRPEEPESTAYVGGRHERERDTKGCG
jgi:hypothetical protein